MGTVSPALSLTPFLPPSTVKADKKAAQEKMIQQEHERQVRLCSDGQGMQVGGGLDHPS